MSLSREEREKQEKFEATYSTVHHPARLDIERAVLGSDYGANSFTTTDEATLLMEMGHIDASSRVLDVGCGAGYPGLYIANTAGCSITLIDLPRAGLLQARSRAAKDRTPALIAQASAAQLPFAEASFDVVLHSDVLC